MAERVISSALSADVIELLMKRGMTMAAIAETIGVSKSFVSRVKSRSRSLTIDHLVALEGALREPLPLLLLQATPLDSVRSELRPLYQSTLRAISGRTRPRSTTRSRRKVA